MIPSIFRNVMPNPLLKPLRNTNPKWVRSSVPTRKASKRSVPRILFPETLSRSQVRKIMFFENHQYIVRLYLISIFHCSRWQNPRWHQDHRHHVHHFEDWPVHLDRWIRFRDQAQRTCSRPKSCQPRQEKHHLLWHQCRRRQSPWRRCRNWP